MDKIMMGHGSGGRMMHDLVDSLFVNRLDSPVLSERKDSGIVSVGGVEIAFSTDSYVVNPLFFPGGDIGSLAVYGTVNDLAVCGAEPKYISLGLMIEEGFDKELLERIADSIAAAARISGVKVITGDTKVVEKGSCDKIFINTSGIGPVYYRGLSAGKIRPGDVIIVSGSIGDHAIAVLSKRDGLSFAGSVKSDSTPLNRMIKKAIRVSKKIRFMRDPTRGGLATTLNEVIRDSAFGISIDEDSVPVNKSTRQACEILGLDPLYLACEGRAIIIVAAEDADRVLKSIKKERCGKGARVVGRITKDRCGRVYLNTVAGGKRVLDMLSGDQLPRIC